MTVAVMLRLSEGRGEGELAGEAEIVANGTRLLFHGAAELCHLLSGLVVGDEDDAR